MEAESQHMLKRQQEKAQRKVHLSCTSSLSCTHSTAAHVV